MKAVDAAYAVVREGIFSGRFEPGDRITEQQVVELSGVSRTPVREALRRLQTQGLVEVQPNLGAVVASWSSEDTEEIFELRALLECFATRLAGERITAEHLERMRELAQNQLAETQCNAPDLDRIAALNNQFHQELYAAAGNRRLNRILVSLIEPTLVIRTFQHYSAGALLRSARQHLEVVEMFETGDIEGAEAVMRLHVLAARHEYRHNA
jgi:DNA-binding GntR family transcriptional regulator